MPLSDRVSLPLAGLTVIAVEQAVAAPLASRHLADLGARVIKIERPGVGDFARGYDVTVRGMSSQFVWLNRSKESLTLDLQRSEGREILRRLLSAADIFVHNLAPGAVARLGFGVEAVRQTYPTLIVCEISGYGRTGAYHEKKAYDLLIQSEVGLLSITGTPESPSKSAISIADIASGMYAFSSILAALLLRQRTGQGTSLDISLFESLGEWMSYPAYYTMYGGTAPPRAGARHAVIAPYGPYASGDSKTVFLGVQNEREWVRFCNEVLERPDLATDSRFASNTLRVQNRDALDEAIRNGFRRFTAEEVVARLDGARIANGRMNSVEEFVAHPQLAARDRWRTCQSPVGPLRALLPPFGFDGSESRMDAVPGLGEHTDAILQELGFDDATASALRRDGVI